MRPAFLAAIALAGCLPSGGDPYAGWEEVIIAEGGYSLRYLAPPWERDMTVLPPDLRLVVPFQHSSPPGLPAPPPAYILEVTGVPAAPTDALASAMEITLADRGDEILVTTTPFETRSGLAGHWVMSKDEKSRYHRETFIGLTSGDVLGLSLESNDDAGGRDIDDLLGSLEAVP